MATTDLAEVLGVDGPVWSDNLAPVKFRAAHYYWLTHPERNSRTAEDLVISILKAAMDIESGYSEDNES